MSSPASELRTNAGFTELEVVELLAASARWPAGTVGTIVHMTPARPFALVEIVDERDGSTLEMLDVPLTSLRRTGG